MDLYVIKDEQLLNNPVLLKALQDTLALPEMQETLREAYALHGKPLEYTLQPYGKGPSYNSTNHRVHLPVYFHRGYETLSGDTFPASFQRYVVHETRHASQSHDENNRLRDEIAPLQEQEDRLAAAHAAIPKDLRTKLQEISDKIQREESGFEQGAVAFTDTVMAKHFNEPTRRSHENGRPLDQFSPKPAADACYVYALSENGDVTCQVSIDDPIPGKPLTPMPMIILTPPSQALGK